MLRRIFLVLLMFGLALPAAAAPLHCVPMSVRDADHAVMNHGKHEPPGKKIDKHDCIGCIVSNAADAPAMASGLVPRAMHKAFDDLLLARLTAGPDTPPPRT